MVQIGLGLIAAYLVGYGIYALSGMEKAKKKTAPAVAIAMIVIGVALLVFTFVFLPMLFVRP